MFGGATRKVAGMPKFPRKEEGKKENERKGKRRGRNEGREGKVGMKRKKRKEEG